MDAFVTDKFQTESSHQAFRRDFIIAISRGGALSFTFVDSLGIRYLLDSMTKKPIEMTGLSRRSIARGTEQLYTEFVYTVKKQGVARNDWCVEASHFAYIHRYNLYLLSDSRI